MKRFFILCYDGDTTGNQNTNNQSAGVEGDDEKLFSQKDLNKYMAEDRRKHDEQKKKIETQKTQIEEKYKELLADKSLSEEGRATLETQLEDLHASFRTKEQQSEFERKQAKERYEEQLTKERTRGDHWEGLYRDETLHRSLSDAASDPEFDAWNPSQIVAFLKPHTELKDEEGRLSPMVNFPDVDEKDGKDTTTLRTPRDAVKRMFELKSLHGNFFKSGQSGGIGGNQQVIEKGELDYSNMSAEEFRKNRDRIKSSV